MASSYDDERGKFSTSVNPKASDPSNKVPCTQDDIYNISKTVSPKEHRELGRILGVPEQEILYIETQTWMKNLDYSEIPYQVLTIWLQNNGKRATRDVLNEAIEKTRLHLVDTCSPVSSEAVHEDIKKLQKHYYRKLKLPRSLWLTKKNLDLEELFVELTLTRREKEGRRVSKILMQEIFLTEEDEIIPRILIEGQPGYGKTTLLLKLLSDWSRGEDYISSAFELVFVIPLRSFKGRLSYHLHQQCHKVTKTEQETMEIVNSFENRVLILLDGWDEATEETKRSLLRLVKGIRLHKTTVVVTCLTGHHHWPGESGDDLEIMESGGFGEFDKWSKRIQIKGVAHEKRKEFLQKYLNVDCLKLEMRMNESGVKVNDLYECPLFLLLLGVFIEEEQESLRILKTKTEFYSKIINFVVHRNLVKENLIDKDQQFDVFNFEIEASLPYRVTLVEYGRLCLEKAKNHHVSFSETEVSINDFNLVCLGFLSKDIVFFEREEQPYYETLHKSFLEFFAAFYLSTLDEAGLAYEIKELFGKIVRPSMDQLLLSFLGGLLGIHAWKLFNSFLPWKEIIGLFDMGTFETTYNFESVLNELHSATNEILNSLKPFAPNCISYNNEYDCPSKQFLSKWVASLMGQNIIKELKFKFIHFKEVHSLNWVPEDVEIGQLVFDYDETHRDIELSGPVIKCRKLVINNLDSILIKCPSMLKNLLAKFPSETLSLHFSLYSVNIEEFYDFYRELTEGVLSKVNLDYFSAINIDLKVPKFLQLIGQLIIDRKIKSGILISLRNLPYPFPQDEMNSFFNTVAFSAVRSFTFEAVIQPFHVPASFFTTDKEWELLKFIGEISLEKNIAKTISSNDISCIEFSLYDISLLDILSKCRNLQILSCDSLELFNDESFTTWQGYLSIKELELQNQTVDENFFRLISKFTNLKKLAIVSIDNFDFEAKTEVVEILFRTVLLLKSLRELIANYVSIIMAIEFLKRLSNSTEEERKTIGLQKLTVNALSVNPFPSLDVINLVKEHFHGGDFGTLKRIVWKRQHLFEEVQLPEPAEWTKLHLPLKKFYVYSKLMTSEGTDIGIEEILDQILHENTRRILVEGASGMGKSTLCAKLMSNWIDRFEHKGCYHRLVILMNLHNYNNTETLEKFLIRQCRMKDLSDDDILRVIKKHQHCVLLIIDDFDELLKQNEAEFLLFFQNKEFHRLPIIFMCTDNAFVSNMKYKNLFNIEKKFLITGIDSNHAELIAGYEYAILKEKIFVPSDGKMLSCPIFFMFLIKIFKEQEDAVHLKSTTVFYRSFFNFILKRCLVRRRIVETNEEVEAFYPYLKNQSKYSKYIQAMKSFGKFALEFLKNKDLIFDSKSYEIADKDNLVFSLGIILRKFTSNDNEKEIFYKPLNRGFLEILAASAISSELIENDDEIIRRQLKPLKENGVLFLGQSPLLYIALTGFLNTKAYLLCETFLPVSHSFNLDNAFLIFMLLEITDIDKFLPYFQNFLPSFMHSTLNKNFVGIFNNLTRETLPLPLHLSILNHLLKNNLIPFLRWDPCHHIHFTETYVIDHLLIMFTHKYCKDNYILGMKSLKCKRLSLHFRKSFKAEHWQHFIASFDLISHYELDFVFDGNCSCFLESLHNVFSNDLQLHNNIQQLSFEIDCNDGPNWLRLVEELARENKISKGIYINVTSSDGNEETKRSLQELIQSVKSKKIENFLIYNSVSDLAPALDSSSCENYNQWKSFKFRGYFALSDQNKVEILPIDEAAVEPIYSLQEKNFLEATQLKRRVYLCCQIQLVLKENILDVSEIEEITLLSCTSKDIHSEILFPLLRMNHLQVLSLVLTDQYECNQDWLCCLIYGLNLRMLEVIDIPSSFIFNSVVRGLDKGFRTNSKVRVNECVLQELSFTCSFSHEYAVPLHFERGYNDGLNSIQKLLAEKYLGRFCIAESRGICNASFFELWSVFPFRDGFRICTEIDGMDSRNSLRSKIDFQRSQIIEKFCITKNTIIT